MTVCFECQELIGQTGFRLGAGSVDYSELPNGTYQLIFIPEPFEDESMFKYLCPTCAEMYEIFMDELDVDACLVIDKVHQCLCGCQFEPASSLSSDHVLNIEWGEFHSYRMGPHHTRTTFVMDQEARVHYDCAETHWGLTLCERDTNVEYPPALRPPF